MHVTSGSLNYRYDFLKFRFAALMVSVLLLAAGLVGYFVKGGFNYHIDFTGGAELRISFENSTSISDVRSAFVNGGWSDAVIQSVGTTGKDFLIRIGGQQEPDLEVKIKSSLVKEFPDNKAAINNVEWVGPEVGKDTQWNAFKTILFALAILLFYIAVRSEFRFAAGAILALVHDILIVLVFLLLTGEQVSLNVLAAVLAILGYSLNDTIVIFSRIRDNMKKYKGVSEYEIVNLSLNQTLTRTILTSLSTFLAVLSILFLGGQALRGFSLVMCMGVICGTYSSIYIASAVMMAIKQKKEITQRVAQ